MSNKEGLHLSNPCEKQVDFPQTSQGKMMRAKREAPF
jgi:hypothetical protein